MVFCSQRSELEGAKFRWKPLSWFALLKLSEHTGRESFTPRSTVDVDGAQIGSLRKPGSVFVLIEPEFDGKQCLEGSAEAVFAIMFECSDGTTIKLAKSKCWLTLQGSRRNYASSS